MQQSSATYVALFSVVVGTCVRSATSIEYFPSSGGSASNGGNASTPTKRADTYIYADDFDSGTYRITEPGKYCLYQDVEFEPKGHGVTEALFPDQDSKKYPQLGGYFLGFFAVMTVEADNVEIDCKGHEIKMSERFWKHQRHFAIIELGSKPFLSGQGPPQFSSYITSPGPLRVANNVTISNCKLGRSSHHGIHGNNNRGVTLRNIEVKDFEVGGIALNGATDVRIENANLGPSLPSAFSALLSQAIFLDHLANTLLPMHPDLQNYVQTTFVTLRGESKTVKSVFSVLQKELQTFLASGEGSLRSLFGDGTALPDGSAVYGLLLHRTGVAIGDFASGCALDNAEDKMVGPVTLKNIRVHDLKINVDQVTRTVLEKGEKQLMGPAGDVFQVTRLWNKNSFAYVGNPLSDAQLAMAKLKDTVESWQAVNPITWADAKFYFGALNLPKAVQDWASGDNSDAHAWKDQLVEANAFKCDGDAMTHHNKGVVGIRLEYQKDVEVDNCEVIGLMNVGKKDEEWCTVAGYKGNDIRGVSLVHVKPVIDSTRQSLKEAFKVSDMNTPNGVADAIVMLQAPDDVSATEDGLGLSASRTSRRLRPASMTMRADDISPPALHQPVML